MLRRAAFICAIVSGAALPASASAVTPRYALETCSRVALVDATTGEKIRGAEDLAVDSVRQRLIVSAHDRRAVAKAASKGAAEVPEGGIYAVAFDALRAGEAPAAPLVAPETIDGGLRPHGLIHLPQTDEIAFVNRAYQKIAGKWRLQSNVERIAARDGAPVAEPSPAHCAANDLVADESGLLVSFDHGACNWRRSLEDAFVLRRSGVSDEKGATLFDGASYANGLARLDDGSIAMAATRERALLILEGPGRLKEARRIALPGGPDNLTMSGDKIVAAVHPSTMRLAASLKLGIGEAPSRVVKVDPADGSVDLLFDDPSGKTFAGATVAVERDGVLILGSATDEGLLVCSGSEPAKS